MIERLSKIVAAGCLLSASGIVILIAVSLLRFEIFQKLAEQKLSLPIQWDTVTDVQWYTLWFITALFLCVGAAGLLFLNRAFSGFSQGQLFTETNSRNLRLFAICLLVQGVAKPIHYTSASVILSLNHPAGERVMSVSLGSNELLMIGLGLVMWVMSELLLKAGALEQENQRFV